jgi:hypothetical protein
MDLFGTSDDRERVPFKMGGLDDEYCEGWTSMHQCEWGEECLF